MPINKSCILKSVPVFSKHKTLPLTLTFNRTHIACKTWTQWCMSLISWALVWITTDIIFTTLLVPVSCCIMGNLGFHVRHSCHWLQAKQSLVSEALTWGMCYCTHTVHQCWGVTSHEYCSFSSNKLRQRCSMT